MYPTFWTYWAPQLHWPLSGSVAQSIDLFDSISPPARGTVERRAFATASYGRQLGWITEVLLDLANKRETTQGKQSLARLEKLSRQIADIKNQEFDSFFQSVEDHLQELRENDPESFKRAVERMRRFFP